MEYLRKRDILLVHSCFKAFYSEMIVKKAMWLYYSYSKVMRNILSVKEEKNILKRKDVINEKYR